MQPSQDEVPELRRTGADQAQPFMATALPDGSDPPQQDNTSHKLVTAHEKPQKHNKEVKAST